MAFEDQCQAFLDEIQGPGVHQAHGPPLLAAKLSLVLSCLLLKRLDGSPVQAAIPIPCFVQPLNNTHASAAEKGGKGFQVVDLADEANGVKNEERFELEEGFFRQDYRIIRIDSCISSSVSPVLSVVNSASFGVISAQDLAEFRGCLRSGWCAEGFCGRIGRRGFRRWRLGWW